MLLLICQGNLHKIKKEELYSNEWELFFNYYKNFEIRISILQWFFLKKIQIYSIILIDLICGGNKNEVICTTHKIIIQ